MFFPLASINNNALIMIYYTRESGTIRYKVED